MHDVTEKNGKQKSALIFVQHFENGLVVISLALCYSENKDETCRQKIRARA